MWGAPLTTPAPPVWRWEGAPSHAKVGTPLHGARRSHGALSWPVAPPLWPQAPSHLLSLSSSLTEPQTWLGEAHMKADVCKPRRGPSRGQWDVCGLGERVPGGDDRTFPSFPASCDGTGAAGACRLGDHPTLSTVTRQKGPAAGIPASGCPRSQLHSAATQKPASALLLSYL